MRMTDGEGKCNTPARWVTGANRENAQERDSKKKKGHSQLMLHYILPPTSLKCHFILMFSGRLKDGPRPISSITLAYYLHVFRH